MKSPISILGTLSLPCLLAGCGGHRQQIPPLSHLSSPIVGGTVDSADSAVVLVNNQTQGFLCSGTLISPTVVLTAGHCSIEGNNTPSPPANPGEYLIQGGTNPLNSPDWSLAVSEVHPDPNLVLNSNTIDNDMGILVLVSPAPVAPMPWLALPDNAVYAIGTSFKAVGYGITTGTGNDAGTKRDVTMTIGQVFSDYFEYGSSTANTCSGDSGGPAIATVGGVATVIGTTSWGDQNCSQVGADMSTFAQASFISQYATPSGGTPTPAPQTDNDDHGVPAVADAVGCSVGGGGGSPFALLALGGLALFARRRR